MASAEGTPISGEPTGHVVHHGRVLSVYVEASDLPDDPRLLTLCEEHRREGRFANLSDEFWREECLLPTADEEPIVRFQHQCPGPNVMRSLCRLAIAQYDSSGNEINIVR